MNLEEFIHIAEHAPIRYNGDVHEGVLRAYLRWTRRYILTEDGHMVMHNTIDIGNVSVPEREQRKGVFRGFLEKLERTADQFGRTLYVENVLNPNLAKFLSARKGFRLVPDADNLAPCFYRTPPRSEETA